METPEVIVVCGPTASGKTAKAMDLADTLGGEIVSVDSVQIYRGMDIGTAKPDKKLCAKYPHHMIDIINPDEAMNAQSFAGRAMEAVRAISGQGKVPILSGGTGLYFKAILEGFFEAPSADPALRESLGKLADEKGKAHLHAMLRKADPDSAASIHPNNLHRVIRALELVELTGSRLTALKANQTRLRRLHVRAVHFLNPPREELYRNIESRTEKMFKDGLVEEARGLLRHYDPGLKPFRSIGYKETIFFLQGSLQLEAAKELIKKNTRNYAKRQITWFTRQKIG